jgi:hypothetical protein
LNGQFGELNGPCKKSPVQYAGQLGLVGGAGRGERLSPVHYSGLWRYWLLPMCSDVHVRGSGGCATQPKPRIHGDTWCVPRRASCRKRLSVPRITVVPGRASYFKSTSPVFKTCSEAAAITLSRVDAYEPAQQKNKRGIATRTFVQKLSHVRAAVASLHLQSTGHRADS